MDFFFFFWGGGGWGAKGMLPPPPKLWGGLPPWLPPLPTPMKMQDSFYRCKTLSPNQVVSRIPLAGRFCPSPKLHHHLHLFMIITFTCGYLSLGSR